jgi:hypothetical protein
MDLGVSVAALEYNVGPFKRMLAASDAPAEQHYHIRSPDEQVQPYARAPDVGSRRRRGTMLRTM